MSEQAAIQSIRVEVNSRYIIIVTHPGLLTNQEVQAVSESLKRRVADWWASGDKFAVLTVGEGLQVSLERIEEPSE